MLRFRPPACIIQCALLQLRWCIARTRSPGQCADDDDEGEGDDVDVDAGDAYVAGGYDDVDLCC